MANALRTALSVSTGRYWWVLVVRDCANGGVAHIVRVLRGRGAGHSYVDLSCSGSFEVCRRFQTANGGSADGVLLVDDATPVKMVQVGDEEFKRENFECVTSIDGDYAVFGQARLSGSALPVMEPMSLNMSRSVFSRVPSRLKTSIRMSLK